MFTYVPYFFFIFNLLFIVTATDDNPPYTPTDYILLSCGASSKTTSSDGRNWDSDAGLRFSPSNMATISSAVTANEQGASVPQVPYLTARVTRSQFSYTFFVSPGKKFLRLYFYPVPYSYSYNLSITESYFAVTANQYLLFRNFSAFLTVSALDFSPAFVVKEFIINVQDGQFLNVTFLPSSNSFAFVNGIEVVSTPDNLYMGNHDLSNNPLKYVNSPNIQLEFDQNNTAFETLYRLNVGGSAIAAVDDSGMFREWPTDDKFVWGADKGNPLSNNSSIAVKYTSQTPNYTAPPIVYTTARSMGKFSTRFNLSWIFPVEPGFYYLLRLHFCEINPDIITKVGQRVFIIYISNRTAEPKADVIYWTGGPGIPIFRDYVVFVPSPPAGRSTKQDLFLDLHPNLDVNPEYADAILNGLEILKLSSSDGSPSMAGTNLDPNSPAPNTNPPAKKKSSGKSRRLLAVIGGAIGGSAAVLILGFFILRQRRGGKDFDQKGSSKSPWAQLSTPSRSAKTNAPGSSSLPSDLGRRFSHEEIIAATANFNANFVIGTGGFGNVYKGYIDNNVTIVAIKRLNPSSSQGAHEFQTEIEMLSKLRHRHLVSLIGYCDEKGEMILIYDYMPNGTLRDQLYKTDNPPLAWKQRLQICIGAAKGLQYLHTGVKHNIIHRDVKSTNILLDEKWVAKVSDFGLSKLGPSGEVDSHVSTQVKGSFGYIDPEYYKKQQLTDKSDVYSFGVVLFEVLCSRAAIIPNLPEEQVNLAEWAKRCYKKGIVDQIVDSNVKGEIAPKCLRSFTEIAINCLKEKGTKRPGMNDVVWSLEFALQLQEVAEKEGGRPPFPTLIMHAARGGGGGGDLGNTTEDDTNVFSEIRGDQDSAAELKNGGITIGTSTASRDKCNSIFSEIMNPTGR